MSFIARKFKTKPKLVNRSSLGFKIKSLFSRRKSKTTQNSSNRLGMRGSSVRPATPVIKRKLGLIKSVDPRILRILLAAFGFALMSFMAFVVISTIREPMYLVDNFDIIGNNSYPTEKIVKQLSKFKGQSIFLISSKAVEDAVRKDYTNLMEIKVDKVFPNRIVITLSEKEVRAVLININGAYLIDEDSTVINVLTHAKINYDQARLDLLSGFADQNSPLIRDIFLQRFITERGIQGISKTEQDKIINTEFNFDTIPNTSKLNEYNKLKRDIQMEVDALTGEVIRKVSATEYNTFPQIIVLNNQMYEVTNSVDKKRLDLTFEVLKYFSDPLSGPTVVGHILWEGQMLVDVPLSNNTHVIFGVLKKASYQLEDYEIIINYLTANNKKYSQIDLSSNKIAVK